MNRLGYIFSCILFLSSFLLAACSKPLPDEKQIMLNMEQMQQAAEEKQLVDLMRYFHGSFRGRHNMPRQALQARIYFHFRINPRVRVFISNTEIQLDGNQAQVSCHMLVTGSHKLMPERGRLYRITSSWRKDEGQWRVYQADWDDAIEQLIQ